MFLKLRTINAAMKALRETMYVVPGDDPSYFPPPAIMRLTVGQMYESLRRQPNVRDFDGLTAKAAARLVVLGLALAFEQEPRPALARWCVAASKWLGTPEDSEIRQAENPSRKREPFVNDRDAEEEDSPASDEEIEAMTRRWDPLGDRWVAIGQAIATDCLENGLREGGIVRYSEIKQYIESKHKYNTSAVQYGFTSRMKQFVDSGEIINVSAEGGDIVFVHEKHADELPKDV